LEIRDKKGVENLVADHLSHIEQEENSNEFPIDDAFPDEYLLSITANLTLWYAPFINFFSMWCFFSQSFVPMQEKVSSRYQILPVG